MLIYLSPEHARAFLDRIADSFPPQTTLFLGAAETIWQISDRLEAIATRDTFIYRRKSTAHHTARLPTTDHPRAERSGASMPRRHAAPVTRVDRPATRRPPMSTGSGVAASPRPPVAVTPVDGDAERLTPAALLAQAAHGALDAGNYDAAIVAFRKCVHLSPHDPVAQLHLGLALEAAGQQPSARRAYTAARRALLDGAAEAHAGIKGFAPGELVRLLDSKLKGQTP